MSYLVKEALSLQNLRPILGGCPLRQRIMPQHEVACCIGRAILQIRQLGLINGSGLVQREDRADGLRMIQLAQIFVIQCRIGGWNIQRLGEEIVQEHRLSVGHELIVLHRNVRPVDLRHCAARHRSVNDLCQFGFGRIQI